MSTPVQKDRDEHESSTGSLPCACNAGCEIQLPLDAAAAAECVLCRSGALSLVTAGG